MADTPPATALSIAAATVHFTAGTPVLDNVDLSIRQGEFVSLVGPSGCGKSTILRLLAGLLEPNEGTVRRGENLTAAFVFQEPNLLPWRSVVENIRLPLELARVSRQEQQRRIEASLALIGLEESDWNKKPRMLSGGMRMRVSLARALVTEPDVLLLDEPFAALDDMLRQQLNEDVLRIHEARVITTLFVTHNVSEAVFLSERVLVMSSTPGRLVDEFMVPFESPRTASLKAEPRFASLAGDIAQRLREV